MNHYDFLKSRYFNLVSRDKSYITVDDQIAFLEYNGYRPSSEDLEAILRRCDHSGDQLLSYSEFSEMTAFVEDITEHRGTGSPSSLGNRPSYSPIRTEPRPYEHGGSAGRYERINTFGASPSGNEERAGSGLKLRATDKPSREDLNEEATPVLGGARNLADE
jgi:Ca2+-binding EF-hand superfamily protein